MKRYVLIFLISMVLFPAGTAEAAEPLNVFVSVLPQQYFVEKIGGEHVSVSVMVAPGGSPATYEPKPKQMATLSGARLYFAVGVPFENAWLDRIASASPDMQIIYTQEGIEKRSMAAHHHHDEDEHAGEKGHQHEEDHDGIKDPHIWLSPPLVMLQARHILTALADADPENHAVYEDNYSAFMQELVELDRGIRRIFADAEQSREFMVFHPAWGYFADAYGLRQVPVEVEGKEPGPADLQHLIRRARDMKVRAIFVQPQFSRKSADMIAEAVNAQVIAVDPLSLDWADTLRRAAATFKDALD